MGKKLCGHFFNRGNVGWPVGERTTGATKGEVTKPPQQPAHHIAPNFFTPSKAEEPEEKSERRKEKQRNPEVDVDESVCWLAAVL